MFSNTTKYPRGHKTSQLIIQIPSSIQFKNFDFVNPLWYIGHRLASCCLQSVIGSFAEPIFDKMEKKDNNLVFYVSKDRNGSEFILVDQNRTTSSKSFIRLTYTILSNITLLCFYYYRNIWSKLCVHIWCNKKFSIFLITLLAVSCQMLRTQSGQPAGEL